MRCRRCGQENERSANSCSSCGDPLGEETSVSVELIEGRRALEEETGDALDQIPAGMGVLIVRRGPNAGSTFAVEPGETTLGRSPDSNIFLDDVTVSRNHAVIRHHGAGFAIADSGSLNGTYVDRERVDAATLHDMSDLQIGRFVLTLVIGTEAGGST